MLGQLFCQTMELVSKLKNVKEYCVPSGGHTNLDPVCVYWYENTVMPLYLSPVGKLQGFVRSAIHISYIW